jgi:hypothetical protein
MREAWLIVLLSVFMMIAVPGYAQTKVSTVPISKDVVVLRLVVGQAPPARVVSLNGGLIRLAVLNGPILALVPVLRGSAISVNVMEIVTNPATGCEGVRQLAKVDVPLGAAVRYDVARLSLEIGLTEIKPPAGSETVQSGDPCTVCCVTCGDLTVCACGVQMECGVCCCPAGGCGCEIERGPSKGGPHSAVIAKGCAVTRLKHPSK